MTKNLTGQKFGRWTVIGVSEKRKNGDNGTRVYWECLCDCGNRGVVVTNVLTRGSSKSCGCLKKERPKILPYGIPERNTLLRTYKKNAERRNFVFSLTDEQFEEIIHQYCYYCGDAPKKILKGRGFDGKYVYNGIDRVDNSIGYIYSNCVPCCETCNRAKRTQTKDGFLNWILRVYNKSIMKSEFYKFPMRISK